MNIFVLSTGRCGSLAFARACEHVDNYSVGHESNSQKPPRTRLEFPENHIEVDNRLSWFLGSVHKLYPDAVYVHLRRDQEAVAKSHLKRWTYDPPLSGSPRNPVRRWYRRCRERHPGPKIVMAFAYPVMNRTRPWPHGQREEVCRFYCETVDNNIALFLQGRPSVELRMERVSEDFSKFWEWIGATGKFDAAVGEFNVGHNASR